MGFSRGPIIPRNDFHLLVDPASERSYPNSGTTLFDLSGNGRDFSLVNSPTISNGVIELVGGGPHLGHAETFDWTATSFTLSVWAYPESTSYPAVLDLISAGNGHFRLSTSSTPALVFRTPGGSVITLVNGGSISLNNWYNLIATRSGDSYNIYLNGENVGSNTSTALNNSNGMTYFRIGYSPDYDAGDRTYTGKVGQVVAYQREWSENEVETYFNSTKSRYL